MLQHDARIVSRVELDHDSARAEHRQSGFLEGPWMRVLSAVCIVTLLASAACVNSASASPTHVDHEQPAVEQAQKALAALGIYHGTTNGTLGRQTRAALAVYQRKVGLPVTARLDGRTALALASPELVSVCVERSVAIAECLDAIADFQASAAEPTARDGSRE
jgi:hypothetical protein